MQSASGDVRGQNDFCKGVSSLFAGIGNGNASENSAEDTVPNLCRLHRRVEDFRQGVTVYTLLHGYTYASTLCVSVDPT